MVVRIGSIESKEGGARSTCDVVNHEDSRCYIEWSCLSKPGNAALHWWYSVDQIAGKYNCSDSISSLMTTLVKAKSMPRIKVNIISVRSLLLVAKD